MRIQYRHDVSAQEEREYRELLIRIDSWWQAFVDKSGDIARLFDNKIERWDLPEFMDRHLGAVDPGLMWEYGAAINGDGDRLVITAEGKEDLQTLAELVVQRAPKQDRWEFYVGRLAGPVEDVNALVEARTGYSFEAWRVALASGDDGLIDVSFVPPGDFEGSDDDAAGIAIVGAESLFGERNFDRWVGAVESVPASAVGEDMPMTQVQAAFDQLKRQYVQSLPAELCSQWVESSRWSLFTLKPEPAEDYPAREDLYTAPTAYKAMWRCAQGGSFFSERFSRHGETFCYLKTDGSEGLDEEKFADRGEIEDAINEVLKPKGLGCVIGGGTGLRYSYSDLAITNVDEAIPLIRQRLRDGNLPKRSWILFFDKHLGGEWIGIWPDSPPPPDKLAQQEPSLH